MCISGARKKGTAKKNGRCTGTVGLKTEDVMDTTK